MELIFSFLIYLIFSHIISDFVLQPDKWVKDKEEHKSRSKYLYLHAFVAATLAGIASALFFNLYTTAFVFVLTLLSHLIIDLIKTHFNNTLKSFIFDQLGHFAVIIIILSLLFPLNWHQEISFLKIWLSSSTVICLIVVLAGYIVLFRPASILISKLVESWRPEFKDSDGLKNAGKYIGYTERLLIYTLMLLHQYTAIGLLVTAKSILRFNERKTSEYILFGTLLSFSIAILDGIFISLFLSYFLPESAECVLRSLYNDSQ